MAGADVTIHGAPYSVYVRIARMVLEEKGVDYTLEPIDIFAHSDETEAYRDLNPFGKIPTLTHGDFILYETQAITRYVDEAFDGPALQPTNAKARARMAQVVGIVDSFAYRTLVWDIYVAHTAHLRSGGDEHAEHIAAAIPLARTCLGELDGLLDGQRLFGGTTVSLADLHLAPVVGYFTTVPQADELMANHSDLSHWWETMRERESWRTVESGQREA